MILSFFKQFNGIDILTLLIFIYIVYASTKTGFVTELLKLLGVVALIFPCFHLYSSIASWIVHHTSWPVGTVSFVIFILLWSVGLVLCYFIRQGISYVFTIQIKEELDRWGTWIVALMYGWLLTSVILFALLVTQSPYLGQMVTRSFSQRYIVCVSGDVYQYWTEGIVARVFPKMKTNGQVIETIRQARAK